MVTKKVDASWQRRLVAPCSRDCPAGVDVPRYVGYITQGKFAEAQAVVRERIPFPSICGHVCYHPCQPGCRRSQMDAAVSINNLKRATVDYSDYDLWRDNWKETIAPPTGKRVAIVGSGPGGLTAAYYLGKRCGHDVTVYEALPQPGGQLRVGVPHFRLPREELDREIGIATETRVKIITNAPVNSIDEVMNEGFDAMLLAMGAMKPKKLGSPGEDLQGVMDCGSFLQAVNLGQKVNIGKRVAIVGGGNVAMDGARTALRLGVEEVRILYRRTRQEMPAYDFEVHSAEEEGVVIDFLTAPKAVTREGDQLELQLYRMQLGEPDESGRRRPVPVPNSDFTLPVDTLLVAIGLDPTVPNCWGIGINRDGTIQTNAKTLATGRDGVFACGDVVTGPVNVIQAIAGGRQAAEAIDLYLGGDGDISEHLSPDEGDEMIYPCNLAASGTLPPEQQELPLAERSTTFKEAELGLTRRDAINEALRCIRCDLWRIQGIPDVWPKKHDAA